MFSGPVYRYLDFPLEVIDMAGNMDQYIQLFRESHVEDQRTLFGVHVVIFALVNIIWVILNALFVPSRYRWLMFYPVIGWGTLVFIHWWFYVRNASKLCRLREERAISKMARKAPVD
jgi:hypothetical protein